MKETAMNATREETIAATSETEERSNPYYINFNKPYFFEGEETQGVDLSGLKELTALDLISAERAYFKSETSEKPENSLLYALLIANIVCKRPFEFFCMLPAREAEKIKDMVRDFF